MTNEQVQEKDITEIELTEKYEEDLKIIFHCIEKLVELKKERTIQYEKDWLEIQRKFNG